MSDQSLDRKTPQSNVFESLEIKVERLPDIYKPTIPRKPAEALDLERLKDRAHNMICRLSDGRIGLANDNGLWVFYQGAAQPAFRARVVALLDRLRHELFLEAAARVGHMVDVVEPNGAIINVNQDTAAAPPLTIKAPTTEFKELWDKNTAECHSARHHKQLAQVVETFALKLPAMSIDDFNVRSAATHVWVLGGITQQGLVYSLRLGRSLTVNETLTLRLEQPTILIPNLGGGSDHTKRREAVRELFDEKGKLGYLLTALACAEIRPQKRGINVMVGPSHCGKTAIADCIAAALPGRVVNDDHGTLISKTFSPLNKHLCDVPIVIVDEAQAAPLSCDDLRYTTATKLPFTEKYEKQVKRRRTAASFWFGTDWVGARQKTPLDPAADDGLAKRLFHIKRFNDVVVSDEIGELLYTDTNVIHPAVADELRAIIRERIEELLRLPNTRYEHVTTSQQQQEVTTMYSTWCDELKQRADNKDPVVQAFRSVYDRNLPWTVPSAEFGILAEQVTGQKPASATLGANIKQAFPKAVRCRVDQGWGWQNVPEGQA